MICFMRNTKSVLRKYGYAESLFVNTNNRNNSSFPSIQLSPICTLYHKLAVSYVIQRLFVRIANWRENEKRARKFPIHFQVNGDPNPVYSLRGILRCCFCSGIILHIHGRKRYTRMFSVSFLICRL